MKHLNFRGLENQFQDHKPNFALASPFPHLVLDQFLKTASCEILAKSCVAIPDDKWTNYHHVNESKFGYSEFDQLESTAREIIAELHSDAFLDWLANLTGIPNLVVDNTLDGAGFHKILRGGFLNIHTDYLSHPTIPTWSRELNLLLYLNENWSHEYGGHLELWDKKMEHAVKSIEPIFNRCVIFQCSKFSLHGHPTPLLCPVNESRNSFSAYYFTKSSKAVPLSVTNYRARSSDSVAKRIMIFLDKELLSIYSKARRYTPIKDRHISRLLKFFRRGHRSL